MKKKTHIYHLAILMAVVCFLAGACLGNQDAKAKTLDSFRGGHIILSSEGVPDIVWIYTGRRGRFSFDGKGARFVPQKDDQIRVTPLGSFKTGAEGTTKVQATMRGFLGVKRKVTFVVHIIPYPSRFALSPRNKTENLPSQDMSQPMTTTITLKGVDTSKKRLVRVSTTPIQIGETHEYVDPFLSEPKAEIKNNQVTLTAEYPGSYDVAIRYADVEKIFHWEIDGIRCAPAGHLMAPGGNGQISVAHTSVDKFVWRSRDEGVATVSQDGVISAHREGNAIIEGKHKQKGYLVGCAVAVTSAAKTGVIARAKQIASGTYSQARRMSPGYYDCSSLVWLAYRNAGCNFGTMSGSAPVAANEASYLAARGKIYAKWTWQDMQDMRYLAGDIMFRTNTGLRRYAGINHVEIISGYQLERFDPKGKSEVLCTWVNRPPGYSRMIYPHDIIGRP